MRHSALALLCMLSVIGTGTQSARADGPAFGWWPFGEKKTDEAAPPPAATSAATTESRTLDFANAPPKANKAASAPVTTKPSTTGTTSTARKSTVGSSTPSSQATTPPSTVRSLPKSAVESPWYLRSPFASVPSTKSPFKSSKPAAEEHRNAWVERRQAEPEHASPWQAVSNGAHRVGASTKAAWNKTVDVLTPGDDPKKPPARVAKRDSEPSFWSRMIPGQESKQPEGPKTVPEWMAQERLKP